MIASPPRTSLPNRFVSRGLEVAGQRIDVVIDELATGAAASAEAARLAEHLVAARIGCERRLVRVAALMPSGRPVATARGRLAAISVSVSHTGRLCGAAVGGAAGIGLDIVDPTEAGCALDVWLTPDERAWFPDDDGLLRARLWGAKEAAFKAARLDDGFRPRSVNIDALDRIGFRWRVRATHGPVCGQGIFAVAGMHLVAIAIATGSPDAAGFRSSPSSSEPAGCS